jgi:hypothetical protein
VLVGPVHRLHVGQPVGPGHVPAGVAVHVVAQDELRPGRPQPRPGPSPVLDVKADAVIAQLPAEAGQWARALGNGVSFDWPVFDAGYGAAVPFLRLLGG